VANLVSSSSTAIERTSGYSFLSDIPHWQRKKGLWLISDTRHDLDRYLRREVEDELPLHSLKYWIEHAEDLRQKAISTMAIDVLSIPAMSADPEPLFSRYSTP